MQDIENASRVEKPQQCGGINFPERNVRHAKETHEEKRARISRCTDFAIRASLARGSSSRGSFTVKFSL